MVATRAGLSTVELERIRDGLAAGRKPKVVFTESAGQIAGQVGQVVELTDPQLSDEWLVVRFGRDELPFSPADLALAPKAAPARRAGTPSPVAVAATVPAPREESPVTPPSTVDTQANGKGGAARPAKAGAGAAAAKPATPPAPTGKAAAPPAGKDTEPVAEPAPPRKAAGRKAGKPRPPVTLTVTLAYADGEWTVAAQQGAKALARPYVIRPAEALKMVAMLDVPGVHEAVEEIVAAARVQAEAQAERLRAELAEIEARLAELREPA